MNVDKTPVTRMKHPQADAEVRLDGRHRDVNRENVLDPLVVINDERRIHAAAALLTEDPIECERQRALTREDSALVANIRRGMAHVVQRHLSRRVRARKLDVYARRLMDWSQLAAPRHELSPTSMQGVRRAVGSDQAIFPHAPACPCVRRQLALAKNSEQPHHRPGYAVAAFVPCAHR